MDTLVKPTQKSNQSLLPIEVLLIEDDSGDVMLTTNALKRGKIRNNLHLARDGVEGLEFLRKIGKFADVPRPDLILLDLNMPRMNGREFLQEVKADEELAAIPVVVLTTSDAEQDIFRSYRLHASCYLTKPVDLNQFTSVIQSIEDFWFCVVKLPPKPC